MKRLTEIQLILLIAASAAMAQANPYGYPQRLPLGAQPMVRPSFQMNLASGFQAPQFQIVSDQAVASQPSAARIPGQPTPAIQTPTLAKRPPAAAPVLAAPQPVPASQQLTFRGPPIQPAKPFIGWKFGQAARTAESASSITERDRPVRLVPQYTLHLADNPAPPKTRVASKPSPSSLGMSGKFFSLQNKGRNQANHTCPKCGRQKNTAVASAHNGRTRR